MSFSLSDLLVKKAKFNFILKMVWRNSLNAKDLELEGLESLRWSTSSNRNQTLRHALSHNTSMPHDKSSLMFRATN